MNYSTDFIPNNLLTTREAIDSTLWAHWREFLTPGYYFGADNNQDRPEAFNTADLRILAVYLTNGRIVLYREKGECCVAKVVVD